jgi:23S rRNA (uracil1939-C5)-methyltransferase
MEELEVRLDRFAQGGDAVGRAGELVVFVAGALPGERVRARLRERHRRYAKGAVVEVIEPSPDRIEPPCPLFGECGGCQWQMLDYGAQLRWKRALVCEAIERVGGLQGVTVNAALGMEDPWRYRNKGQYPVGLKGSKVVAGYYRRGSHQIVDLDSCPIQHPLVDAVMAATKRRLDRRRIPVYEEPTHRGIVRHLVIRASYSWPQAQLTIVTRTRRALVGLARQLRDEIPELVGVVQNINRERTNVILGPQEKTISGRTWLGERVGRFIYRLSSSSFFQVNPLQTEALCSEALRAASLTGGERVVDVYAGVGTLSLFLAEKARTVAGIENVGSAVRDARKNARLNGVANVSFLLGDARSVLRRFDHCDVLVLDPPRRGCEPEALRAMISLDPKRIVYVSCEPVTLARDLGLLGGAGYRVESVQPIDMFPQTYHIECVARLEKG